MPEVDWLTAKRALCLSSIQNEIVTAVHPLGILLALLIS